MGRVAAIRVIGFYAPVLAAFLAIFLRPRCKRLVPAALLGFLWVLPGLLAVQLLNLRFSWWQFHAQGALFRAMPIDLYLGWAVLWGIVPILVFRKTRIEWVVAVLFALDLILMPACFPVLTLGNRWLIGELAALAIVLVPAQLFARWTLEDTHLSTRAVFQVLAVGGVFLFLIPETVFALQPGRRWSALLSVPAWERNLELQGIFLFAVLGLSAVQEFARRGGGTPVPCDPPKRLVVSGLYRYISNPMQLSCVLVMSAWAGVLRNPWLLAAASMTCVYSLGLASWDEGADMEARFGSPWQEYQKNVRAWRTRLKPWHPPDQLAARLYIAESCDPCSEVRRWFESHRVIALKIVAAEDHPTRDLQRITYDPMDGAAAEQGVCAVARGLEHINLGWAFVGAILRLPGISHLVQTLLDGAGLGPRKITRRSKQSTLSQTASVCALHGRKTRAIRRVAHLPNSSPHAQLHPISPQALK